MKKLHIFIYVFALKKDNSLFCHRDIPTIHNGNCVSNAVDYAKKKDFTNDFSTESRSVIIDFSTEHNLTSRYLFTVIFF